MHSMKDLVTFINESMTYKLEDYKAKCFYIDFYVDEGVLAGRKYIQPVMYMDRTTRFSHGPWAEYCCQKTFKNYKNFQKFLNEVIDDTWVEETTERTNPHTKETYTSYVYKRVDYPNYKELMKSLGEKI